MIVIWFGGLHILILKEPDTIKDYLVVHDEEGFFIIVFVWIGVEKQDDTGSTLAGPKFGPGLTRHIT